MACFLNSACYTDLGQDFSICNYWNGNWDNNGRDCLLMGGLFSDPLQQLKYQEYSDFLYPLNSGGEGRSADVFFLFFELSR